MEARKKFLKNLGQLVLGAGSLALVSTSAFGYGENNKENPEILGAGGCPPARAAIALGDLNSDGLEDLLVLESFSGEIRVYINKGTPKNPAYNQKNSYILREINTFGGDE